MSRPYMPRMCDICGEPEYKGEGVHITVEEAPDGLWRCDNCMDEYDRAAEEVEV